MKKSATAPLTPAEIREGIDRLMSSALMKRDPDSAGDLTGTFKLNIGVSGSEIREAYGIENEAACVIQDLAVALVTKRLTKEEVFRLGTSGEAIRLFEAESDEWNNNPLGAHAANVAAEAPKVAGTEEATP